MQLLWLTTPLTGAQALNRKARANCDSAANQALGAGRAGRLSQMRDSSCKRSAMKAARLRQSLALALLALLPLAAPAADEPEAVYAKFHRAVASGDFEEMLRYGPAARRQEMAGVSQAQRDAALKMANLMLPRAYIVLSKTVNPNGRNAQLLLSGPVASPGGGPETMYGRVRMV